LKKQTLKNKNTTTPISEPIQLLLNIGKGLGGEPKIQLSTDD
jgi:hypothetical protein